MTKDQLLKLLQSAHVSKLIHTRNQVEPITKRLTEVGYDTLPMRAAVWLREAFHDYLDRARHEPALQADLLAFAAEVLASFKPFPHPLAKTLQRKATQLHEAVVAARQLAKPRETWHERLQREEQQQEVVVKPRKRKVATG